MRARFTRVLQWNKHVSKSVSLGRHLFWKLCGLPMFYRLKWAFLNVMKMAIFTRILQSNMSLPNKSASLLCTISVGFCFVLRFVFFGTHVFENGLHPLARSPFLNDPFGAWFTSVLPCKMSVKTIRRAPLHDLPVFLRCFSEIPARAGPGLPPLWTPPSLN